MNGRCLEQRTSKKARKLTARYAGPGKLHPRGGQVVGDVARRYFLRHPPASISGFLLEDGVQFFAEATTGIPALGGAGR